MRAVHVSADAWAHDGLRGEVLRLLDEKRINTVELDLKDESGIVGWRSGVPLAQRIGAERATFDLGAAVKMLHARGARVVGRLVAFRDPVLAEWAWTHGRRDLVIQTPDGGAYSGGYGGFTSYVHPTVRAYNVDLAVAAAKLGVDDVLYDYVRRPDGPLETMVVPGLDEEPSTAVTSFLAQARRRLAPHGTFLGASVFGIAATRPEEIAQDVPAIAREVDYVAPMLYPSHWGLQEYDVASPESEPYAIVRRSLADFKRIVRGTGARAVPWLQDFSLGVQYGEAEVRAQIDGARAAGIDEFLLWDPNVTYTATALEADAALPAAGSRTSAPGSDQLVALPRSRSPEDPVRSGLEPNELGVMPVLMYHQLLADGGGVYDLTPDEFRAELERLHEAGYRPVTASALATGKIDLPRGATPVALTFDDSTTSQAALLPNGRIDPESAVGIMLEFARDHADFRPAGTFYVNRAPFGADPRAGELVERLIALGFELGNHTLDHVRLDELDDDGRAAADRAREPPHPGAGARRRDRDDRASLRPPARPAGARPQRLLGRRGLRVRRRVPRGRRAVALAHQPELRAGGDPTHPHRPGRSLERLVRLASAARSESSAAVRVGREALAAQAAEHGEGIARHDLVHELAACLDLAADALCQLVGLLSRSRADDEVRPPAHDLVAVRLQLVGEVVGLLVGLALDAHLPGREAAGDELLLDVRQVGLRVPAVIVVQPVLEDDLASGDAGLLELGVDERASLRRFRRRRRVDEHRVGVVRHREPVELELLGELLRARRDVDAEPVEEATRLLLFQLDANAPVVPGHRAQPSLP